MDTFQCSICDNAFDGASHRPRALPCGHGFCTQCLETSIDQGNEICPVCRNWHGARSAAELPVSFLLEDFINKAAISSSQDNESDPLPPEGTIGICPKHQGVPLFFHCLSHNVKICHSCAVIEHQPSSCDLISLCDEIKKQSQIITVKQQIQDLMYTEFDLKMLIHRNSEYLTQITNRKGNLEKEMEKINQEILKTENSQEQTDDAIKECQQKQISFQIMENILKAARSNQNIAVECDKATNEILQSQRWERTLREELNVRMNKCAQVVRNGVSLSSWVFTEGGRLFIPSLSTDVKPLCSNVLIQEAELGLTSPTITVWMDFSVHGQNIGRVHINVMSDRAHGGQFIMLALGIEGSSFKGAKLNAKTKHWMGVHEYVTEDGLHSSEPLVTTLKKEHFDAWRRGRLFSWRPITSASFLIITQNHSTAWPGYFGDIVTGMEVIDRISSDEYAIKDITISECGIILDY